VGKLFVGYNFYETFWSFRRTINFGRPKFSRPKDFRVRILGPKFRKAKCLRQKNLGDAKNREIVSGPLVGKGARLEPVT